MAPPQPQPSTSLLRAEAQSRDTAGSSPACPCRITQSAASWAKPQMTSARTGGWWRRQHMVRALGAGTRGGAAGAASAFAFPGFLLPPLPRPPPPPSLSDTTSSGCCWGAWTHGSVRSPCVPLPSSLGLSVTSQGSFARPYTWTRWT